MTPNNAPFKAGDFPTTPFRLPRATRDKYNQCKDLKRFYHRYIEPEFIRHPVFIAALRGSVIVTKSQIKYLEWISRNLNSSVKKQKYNWYSTLSPGSLALLDIYTYRKKKKFYRLYLSNPRYFLSFDRFLAVFDRRNVLDRTQYNVMVKIMTDLLNYPV